MRTFPTDPSQPDEPSYRMRHTPAQFAVLALNILVVLACLGGAVALLYGKNELDGRLQTAKVQVQVTTATAAPASTAPGDTTGPTGPPETFPVADPAAQNFLITGSDANACNDPNSPWAGATVGRDALGSRSDTIMVMRVDPTTRAAAVLSFPRDLWVKIPGHGKNKINSAYVKDDYTLLANTIYNNFGIKIDHYVQVDFCAFKRIVDAVGGVGVPFATPVVDKNIGLNIKAAGCHTFSGDEALAYVRSRHLKSIDANGQTHEDGFADLARISRQQDFLRRVLRKALDKGLFDPKVARGLLSTLQSDIVTEQGFTVDDMLKFAGVMHDVAPESIRTYQVDSTGKMQGQYAVQVYVQSTAMTAILAIFQGSATLIGAPEQASPTSSTADGGLQVTTTTAAPAPGVTQPADNTVGQIVPDKNIVCT